MYYLPEYELTRANPGLEAGEYSRLTEYLSTVSDVLNPNWAIAVRYKLEKRHLLQVIVELTSFQPTWQ